MRSTRAIGCLLVGSAVYLFVASTGVAERPHPVLRWVKYHPRETAQGKPPPRMGYETSYGYDGARKLLIRYGGHNQGGGGEQNSEVWTYDLRADAWTLQQPNDAPPGVCCAQQNVFDDALRKFIRFPAFSGSHGWQSRREIELKNSSVWTYDLDENTWRAMRPCPEVWPSPLRGAAYDVHHQVTVLHGGEGANHGTAVYDLYTNTWHRMKPATAPTPRISQPGFTYDAVHRVFVLFGSQFQEDPQTWIYDLRKNTWQVLDAPEHPPASKSSPVLAADTRNGIVLCSVRGADGPETWVLDVAKPSWKRLELEHQPDASGNRNRVLVYLEDENLFVLENRTKDQQQIWTFRYADAPPPVARPKGLRVSTEPEGATLRWQRAVPGKPSGYDVYRGRGEKPWQIQFEQIATGQQDTTFQDRELQHGMIYHYQVRTGDGDGGRSASSYSVRTQPRVPQRPCVSTLEPTRVAIRWAKADAPDVIGYHVERAEVGVYSTDQMLRIKGRREGASDLSAGHVKRIGTFQRLTPTPIDATQWLDEQVDLAAGQRDPDEPLLSARPLRPDRLDAQGKPYRYGVCAYRIIAVNRLGVESGPSPLGLTFPSAPQHVFAKEEAEGATRLRWQPNAEKAIAGYLVYRHDGRWDKDPIVRLTPKPISQPGFLDKTAGSPTRRYEIVAVDVFGQEGEPSRPVWSRREWQRFYEPYTNQWHQ